MIVSLFFNVSSIGVKLRFSGISVEQTSCDCPVMTRAALLYNLDNFSRMELDPSFRTVEQYVM